MIEKKILIVVLVVILSVTNNLISKDNQSKIHDVCKIIELDSLPLLDLFNIEVNKSGNFEFFEISKDIFVEIDPHNCKNIKYQKLNHSIYEYFEKQTNYPEIWAKLKKSFKTVKYGCKVNNSDNEYLIKVLTGVKDDTIHTDNRIDTIKITEFKFVIARIDTLNNYSIKEIMQADNNMFFYEDVNKVIKFKSSYYFPIIPKLTFNFIYGSLKPASTPIIYKYNNDIPSPYIYLSDVNFAKDIMNVSDYSMSNLDGSQFAYYDNNNPLFFVADLLDDKIFVLKQEEISALGNVLDIYKNGNNIYLLCTTEDYKNKLNLIEYDYLLKKVTNIFNYETSNELISSKFIGLHDELIYFVIKDKIEQWKILKLQK